MPSYYKRGAYRSQSRNHNYMKELKSIADTEDSC